MLALKFQARVTAVERRLAVVCRLRKASLGETDTNAECHHCGGRGVLDVYHDAPQGAAGHTTRDAVSDCPTCRGTGLLSDDEDDPHTQHDVDSGPGPLVFFDQNFDDSDVPF